MESPDGAQQNNKSTHARVSFLIKLHASVILFNTPGCSLMLIATFFLLCKAKSNSSCICKCMQVWLSLAVLAEQPWLFVVNHAASLVKFKSQPAFIWSKLRMETPEQSVKSGQR